MRRVERRKREIWMRGRSKIGYREGRKEGRRTVRNGKKEEKKGKNKQKV